MNKEEEKDKEQETALLLLEAFREEILKEDTNDEKYQRILNIVSDSIQYILKGKKIPQDEVNVVYQNVCRYCFVDKIKLNDEEAACLEKIKEFGKSKGFADSIRRGNFSALGNIIGR